MEIKILTNIVPITVNRKVKSRVVVLTEKEAILIRDILGGTGIRILAEAAMGSFNYSRITPCTFDDTKTDIERLSKELTEFADGKNK